MEIKFNSQVFIGNKHRNLFLRILGILIGGILLCAVGIKILVGDFAISDISGIIMSVIIIGVCNSHSKPKPQYASAIGKIEFEQDNMTITYVDVNGGKNVGLYTDITNIHYDEIESIEYGKDLNCFRVVANCLRKRQYVEFQNEKIVHNGDKVETFMYVMDTSVAEDILDNLEKYTGSTVKVLE